jgi:hypothetical protein
MCSAPSSSSTDRLPRIGSSATFASPARSLSGPVVKTVLRTSGSVVNTNVPTCARRTVKRSPYRRVARSMNGAGRAIRAAV